MMRPLSCAIAKIRSLRCAVTNYVANIVVQYSRRRGGTAAIQSVRRALSKQVFGLVRSDLKTVRGMRSLTVPGIFGQGPSSKALRAALTAMSMSAASPSATSMMTVSSWGFMVLKVLPDTASTNLPSMSSCEAGRSAFQGADACYGGTAHHEEQTAARKSARDRA